MLVFHHVKIITFVIEENDFSLKYIVTCSNKKALHQTLTRSRKFFSLLVFPSWPLSFKYLFFIYFSVFLVIMHLIGIGLFLRAK